jgi:hypothetical protein
MPTTPTIQDYNVTLERRVEVRARTAMRLITGLLTANVNILLRDEDDPVIQNGATPLPIIVLRASDTGRYRLTPFRNIDLAIIVRSTKEKADASAFDVVCANVEEWLDNSNLINALTDATAGLYTRLAVRSGTQRNLLNNIREHTYTLMLKVIPGERVIT